MTTFSIPLTTLTAGPHTFGPMAVPDTDTSVTVSVDRTVAGGLNSLTAASTLAMEAQASTDGGVTWHAVDTDQPGTVTQWATAGGGTAPASKGRWPLFPGTGRRVQAIVTAGGPSSIAVSGSVVTA